MTQIVVTLDNNADSSLIQRIIENISGVVSASMKKVSPSARNQEWMDRIDSLANRVPADVIDWDDERTKYLLTR